MTLGWTESLDGPRSLGTAADVAVAVLEDPGVVEISAHRDSAIAAALGLPVEPWRTAQSGTRQVVWSGPDRWIVLAPRDDIDPLLHDLNAAANDRSATIVDLTGAYTAFRIAGAAASDVLMQVCPLDLAPIAAGMARGTSIAGVDTVLIREGGSVPLWLALTPRSQAAQIARALVEAARPEHRIGLFQRRTAPPV